jgi:ATP-binding cassette subfamily F protein uup
LAPPSAKTRKLSYKEQRELDGLPTAIAALEAEQQDIIPVSGCNDVAAGSLTQTMTAIG